MDVGVATPINFDLFRLVLDIFPMQTHQSPIASEITKIDLMNVLHFVVIILCTNQIISIKIGVATFMLCKCNLKH